MDAFAGVGGNTIQFAQTCGYCVGVDIESQKCQFTTNNAKVYGLTEFEDFKVMEFDFLKLPAYGDVDFGFKIDNQIFNAVFMSPPWGGTGYNKLSEYLLEHIYPDFDQVMEKALNYTPNLMIFLPRNTSISDLIKRLLPFQSKLLGDNRLAEI